MVVGVSQVRLHDYAVAVLHQRMSKKHTIEDPSWHLDAFGGRSHQQSPVPRTVKLTGTDVVETKQDL